MVSKAYENLIIKIQEVLTMPRAFTRDATGLVRELGFLDNLLIALGTINIIVGFVLSTAAAFFRRGCTRTPMLKPLKAINIENCAILSRNLFHGTIYFTRQFPL